jgi:hypothetical protein
VYLKKPVLEPELYDMVNDYEEHHNVAAKHPDIVQKMLGMAEQCRADLGDSQFNRKGSGVREPGRVKK